MDLAERLEDGMKRIQFLRGWSIAVGSMDAVTGLLLIFAPGPVLGLLGIATPSADSLVFLSWIGVFVMSVGLSYSMALGSRVRGETVWRFTAWVRILVAVFIAARVIDGSLAPAWVMVGISDGVVGVVQLVILRKGGWREVQP
jgi:hypothetical protein